MSTTAAPNIVLDATSAGRRAIAGFLLQILRSIRIGLDMTVTLTPAEDGGQLLLHLEPVAGSDHQVTGGARDVVEQVKMRTPTGTWNSGEVASKVLSDLLRTVRLGASQEFRFVTNNSNGLGRLREYVDTRDRPSKRLRWGAASVSRAYFEQRLAKSTRLSAVTPEFRHLLDHFEIEIIDPVRTEAEIDAALRPLLTPGQEPGDKRFQLVGQLLTLATGGATLSPAELRAFIHPEAHRRLAHAQSLPASLAGHVEEDAQLIGYVAEQQARVALPAVTTGFAVLSGESGLGKTWTLAQLAFDQIARGELAVILKSPTKLEDVIDLVNDRIWQPAYTERASLSVIAKHLGDAFKSEHGYWLTIYIDDVQDRIFAERLARAKWQQLGIRTIASAQPRITRVIRAIRTDVEVIDIGNFRSADLHRYLTHHGRAEALETMPDDIFELLLKPVHASIFVQLPKRSSWAAASEYELFSTYWDYAGLLARDQSDHPSDRFALTALAGALAAGKSHYPWRIAELRTAGLDDLAILRLEQVGLLRRPAPDRIQLAADRMLNWAVAEALADRIQSDDLSAPAAEAVLGNVEEVCTRTREHVGARLGYVYFDAIWLLARNSDPQWMANLIWEHVARLPQEHRQEQQWRDGFGSIGAHIVPPLELLAQRSFDEERDWDIPRSMPFALAAIAAAEPDRVAQVIARQLASPVDDEVTMGLRTTRLVPAASAIDQLWNVHLVRVKAFAALDAATDVDERSRALSRRSLSFEALHRAVGMSTEWLDKKLAVETDHDAIDQLLWILKDEEAVDADQAAHIWSKHRGRIVKLMTVPSAALVEAIGHFRDTALTVLLSSVDLSNEWNYDRVLRSRARLAPQDAIRQIAEGSDEYGWRAANWWFDELAAADMDGLSAAIRTRTSNGDDPLTDTVLYYRLRPEAIDAETLEGLLDQFTTALGNFNAKNDDANEHDGRLGHPLRFLPELAHVWQFDMLRARAGTPLEEELVRFASSRRGRMSMTRDGTGNECERILAMIGGAGYEQLVLAELARPNVFGRQDGYISAHWSESEDVTAALANTEQDADTESFGQVVRMEALAIHRCDSKLEEMVRAGVSIYVNAANMRSAEGRDVANLRKRVSVLIAADDEQSVDLAAALTGFLGTKEDALPLLAIYLRLVTSEAVRRRILASFRALDFYAPEILPVARDLISGRIDEEAQFVATYLAEVGDASARKAVIDWLNAQDLGSGSTSRRDYLHILLRYPDGKATVLAYLRRSRASGHLVVEGQYLQLLADDGDTWARDELQRSTYRYTGFDRHNTILAIDQLRREEPQEAYFASQRLLTRHAIPAAADLMLIIDEARAGRELAERYIDANSSLRLELRRRLRVRLGGASMASLAEGLADTPSARKRVAAAELAGAVPCEVDLPWLEMLAADRSLAVRDAARAAQRSRQLEAAALAHRELIPSSTKPLQWARLSTIFDLVDPFFLWSSTDPASLEDTFAVLPEEFLVEARQQRQKRLKDREAAAAKAGNR